MTSTLAKMQSIHGFDILKNSKTPVTLKTLILLNKQGSIKLQQMTMVLLERS